MTITLLGYMGSGKSTIGTSLAKALGYEFIDLDKYIELKESTSIKDIFEKNGELGFRKLERKYLIEILNKPNSVIALGGGTPVYYNNIDEINNNSLSIFLQVSIAQLVKRLTNKKDERPLIAKISSSEDLTEFIGKHLFERNPYYSKANYTLKINNQTTTEVLNELMEIIPKKI